MCFYLLVSWLSKKQAVVALSTSEAEYVALSMAAQEAAWLLKLFTDLKMPPNRSLSGKITKER